jgi:hypothetical protein
MKLTQEMMPGQEESGTARMRNSDCGMKDRCWLLVSRCSLKKKALLVAGFLLLVEKKTVTLYWSRVAG